MCVLGRRACCVYPMSFCSEMEQITICCNVKCGERFSCQKFSRAMDVNGGKITANYVEVKCEKFNQYEK